MRCKYFTKYTNMIPSKNIRQPKKSSVSRFGLVSEYYIYNHRIICVNCLNPVCMENNYVA